jgi:hypothetical protein
MKSKYLINDKVKIKTDISDILKNHPQFRQDNRGIDKYLGKKAIITYIVYDDEDIIKPYYRYIINIDDGDYWWVDECFES